MLGRQRLKASGSLGTPKVPSACQNSGALIEFLQLSDIAEFLGRISVHGQSDIGSKADTPG